MQFQIMNKTIIIFGLLLSYFLAYSQPETVRVPALPENTDATPYVSEALKKCKIQKASRLIFEGKNYTFLPDLASEKMIYISNNDGGLKRVAFNLSGINNLEIDGQNAAFMFDGYICPFILDKATNITLKNFSVDFKRSFHSEGIIVGGCTDSLDISFSKAYNYFVHNNKLMFTSDKVISKDNAGDQLLVQYPFWHLLEFDKDRREPAITARDYLNVQNMIVKELNPGVVRIFWPGIRGVVGNTMIFNATERSIPAITISECENTRLLNVTLHHAGGMGVIAQRSRNILLDKVIVTPSQGRMISLAADATHFVNCAGKITMQNCTFENQKDDATNIHGIYVKILELISPNEAIIKLVHYQQFGFDFLKKGVKVEITEAGSMEPYQQNRVKSAERINKEYTRVVFETPIDKKVKAGDIIASTTEYPEVLIKNCIIKNNRARGLLLGSRSKIVVEDCYFHTQCAAINLEGDGRFWFEQSGVRNLTIRNNVFDRCNYSLMLGLGVIMVNSGIPDEKKAVSKYNKNIIIENNTFKVVYPTILKMYSVDNLIYRNNKVEQTYDYKLDDWWVKQKIKCFEIDNSTNISIQE
jgi:hypothetical protein